MVPRVCKNATVCSDLSNTRWYFCMRIHNCFCITCCEVALASFVLLHFISNLQRYPFCLQTQMDYSVTFPDDLCMLCSPAGPWESPPSPCLHTATPRACLTSRLVPRRIVQGCRIGRVRESSASGTANYFLMWRRFFWRACFLADQIPLKGPWGCKGHQEGVRCGRAHQYQRGVHVTPGLPWCIFGGTPRLQCCSFILLLILPPSTVPPRQAAAEPCRNSDTGPEDAPQCRKP